MAHHQGYVYWTFGSTYTHGDVRVRGRSVWPLPTQENTSPTSAARDPVVRLLVSLVSHSATGGQWGQTVEIAQSDRRLNQGPSQNHFRVLDLQVLDLQVLDLRVNGVLETS
jgi:hypothetical protein